jgi:hypothetical protein
LNFPEGSLVENALRWAVTVLFGVSFAGYGYFLIAQHAGRTNAVNHALHLAMSVAMILMVWGVGTSPATIAVMIGFLAAGAWFAGVAARTPWAGGERLTNCYYAGMMATMAWMYASAHRGHPMAAQPATEMPGMPGMPEMSARNPGPGWVTMATWVAIGGFGVLAVFWAFRSTMQRRTAAISPLPRLASAQALTQAFTAAGTALMLADML